MTAARINIQWPMAGACPPANLAHRPQPLHSSPWHMDSRRNYCLAGRQRSWLLVRNISTADRFITACPDDVRRCDERPDAAGCQRRADWIHGGIEPGASRGNQRGAEGRYRPCENESEELPGAQPNYTENQIGDVLRLSGDGRNGSAIAKELGLSRQTINRIQKSPDEAFSNVRAWS